MHCKICGSKKLRFLYIASEIDFNLSGNFHIHFCEKCNYIFVSNPPSPKDIVRYYPKQYQPYKLAIQDEKNWMIKWARFRNITKKTNLIFNLVSSADKEKKVLDIGCSTGIFLDAMKRNEWEVHGVEINAEAAKYAEQRFGINVKTGQFFDTDWEEKYFDVITLWDVLEHTFDPLDTLRMSKNILKDDGLILITIPNYESLDRLIFRKAWIGFDFPRHISAFPEKAILYLISELDMKLVYRSCNFGGYYNFLASLNRWLTIKFIPKFLHNQIMSFLNIPGIRIFFSPFFWLFDKLGIGNNQIIILKKTIR